VRNESLLYDKSYFVGNGYGVDPRRAIAYRQELSRVLSLAPNGGRVLDWGCGTGDFLSMFDDRWTKYGIEISAYAAGEAKKKGITILRSDLLSHMDFDLIIFRGVMQHLDDPFDALRKARLSLMPNGLIAILAQPNAESLVYRLFGDLPALDWPRNYWIPGERELCNVLEHIGLRIIRIEHPYRGGPYANPIRDYLRFIGNIFGGRYKFAFPGNMIEIYAGLIGGGK
jgi:SAM-dependent methyltransferase